ncbi:DNA mismatch repair protein MutL [Actinoplanes sp. NPDC051411]|uniref:DNA mismatch repair protein MutL n=1 Tax=Actinoplanes sp. NPDC051411 TaxID=3155522 RepID=UPI00343D91F5
MRSFRWTPVVGWLAATAASIVLASVALTPVLRTAAPEDTALSSLQQLPAAQTSFPVQLPAVTNSPETPTPTHTRKTTHPTTPPTRKATTTATPPTTTEDGWTVTTGDDGVRTYVRSFRVEGGQAVIKMTSDAVVELVTATPADGYAVQKVQDSPDNMAVYFNKTGKSFIIHATWWDDKPFTEVSQVGQ